MEHNTFPGMKAALDATYAAMLRPPKREHDCLDHIEYREHTATEPHGEIHTDEWWECRICGERFTGGELDRLYAALAAAEEGGEDEIERARR
jgi:hypothetical protein